MGCNKNATSWNYDSVKEYIESFGCKLISNNYTNMRDKITIECGECHNEYSCSFYSFVKTKNKKCRKCVGKSLRPYKYSIQKIREMADNNGCELLSEEYVDVYSKLKFKCSCGNLFETNVNEFVNSNKTRCNLCGIKSSANSKFLSVEYIRNKVLEISDCELLSTEYVSAHKKLKFRCWCGEEFERSWANFTNPNKRRCRKCNQRESNLEKSVRTVLEELKIKFTQQYTYDDCLFKNMLPFDFYLPKYNCCIEVDGEHHFYPIEHFGGEHMFKLQKLRDDIKTEYCKEHGIHLIRIPFFNVKNSKEIIIKEIESWHI